MQTITDASELRNLVDGNKFLGELPVLINSKINFSGKNNIVFCERNVKMVDCSINFNGDDSVLFLCENKFSYKFAVSLHHSSVVYFGKDNYFNQKMVIVTSEYKHVFVGSDCLFSLGIWIRVADPHLIYDSDSKMRINPTKSVYVGDHVWVGQNAFLLKGARIHSGSIVGAMSVVAGKEIFSNESWAGNPAKRVKAGIFWTGKSVHKWIEKDTLNNEKFEGGDIYTYTEDATVSFDKIDTDLTCAKNAMERVDYLISISSNQEKNRFAKLNTDISTPVKCAFLRKLFRKR